MVNLWFNMVVEHCLRSKFELLVFSFRFKLMLLSKVLYLNALIYVLKQAK